MPTIQQIEAAIAATYTGKTLTCVDGNKTVSVIIDTPYPEIRKSTSYPFIALMYADMIEATELLESYEEPEEVSRDESEIPYTRVVRPTPDWYWLTFHLHTFTRDANADRELVQWVLTRKKFKDSIKVTGQDYICNRDRFANLDSISEDQKVWHKAWTVSVLAPVETSDKDEATTLVHSMAFEFGQVRTGIDGTKQVPVDENGNFVDDASEAAFDSDRTIVFEEET